jgi:hypothetical protein
MPDINPIAEGAKSLSEGLNSARQAGKSLTKSIEDIQHDGLEVAKEQLHNKKIKDSQEESYSNSIIFRAINEYETQREIIDAENKAEANFKKKYGAKEWAKVVELKAVVEREHKENKKYYGHKLSDVRRVQFWCFFVAFIITTLLFYFRLV